jgi:hypothetical protein
MATSVGSLAVVISGNAAPLAAELDRAAGSVKGWADKVGLSFGAAGKELAGGIGDSLRGVFDRGLSRFGLAGGAAGLGKEIAEQIVGGIERGLDALDRKAVARIGLKFRAGAAGEKVLAEVGDRTAGTGVDRGAAGRTAALLAGNGMDPAEAAKRAAQIGLIARAAGSDPDALGGVFARSVGRGSAGAKEILSGFAEAGVGLRAIADANGMSVKELSARLDEGRIPAGMLGRTLDALAESAKKANADLDAAREGKRAALDKSLGRLWESLATLPGVEAAATGVPSLLGRSAGGYADAAEAYKQVGWGRAALMTVGHFGVGAIPGMGFGDRPVVDPELGKALDPAAVKANAAKAREAMREGAEANAPTTLGELLRQRGGNPWRDPTLFPTMPDVWGLKGNAGAGEAFARVQDAAGRLAGQLGKAGEAIGGLVGAGKPLRDQLEAAAAGPKSALEAFQVRNRLIDAARAGCPRTPSGWGGWTPSGSWSGRSARGSKPGSRRRCLTGRLRPSRPSAGRWPAAAGTSATRVERVMGEVKAEQERTTRETQRLAEELRRAGVIRVERGN